MVVMEEHAEHEDRTTDDVLDELALVVNELEGIDTDLQLRIAKANALLDRARTKRSARR